MALVAVHDRRGGGDDRPAAREAGPAVIAGGGAAGLTWGVTALLRAKSTATRRARQPFVATGELGGATVSSVLAIFAPIVALVLVVLGGLGLR